MRYVAAKIDEREEELFYRAYVTETTRIGANNTARVYGGQTIEKRYFDFVGETETKVETRTSAQVVSYMRDKINEVADGSI